MTAPAATAARTPVGTEVQALTSTGSKFTRVVGIAVLIGVVVLLWLAFDRSPADARQGDLVRLLYVHFPVIMVAYLAFAITTVGSIMYLWKKSAWWDLVAASSAEIGVLFLGLTLLTGMIWGRPTWNTWWEWGDVRVMTTLMLFLMFVGYVALRAVPSEPAVRNKRAAVLAIVASVNIPIINRSVEWWENRTLHQTSTLIERRIEDMTLFTLVVGFVVFGLMFAWLLMHRFRVGWLEQQRSEAGLAVALAERRAEGDRAGAVEASITGPGSVSPSRPRSAGAAAAPGTVGPDVDASTDLSPEVVAPDAQLGDSERRA